MFSFPPERNFRPEVVHKYRPSVYFLACKENGQRLSPPQYIKTSRVSATTQILLVKTFFL